MKLTNDQKYRAIAILQTIGDVLTPQTPEEWIAGFEKDRDPEQEIVCWENIALSYQAHKTCDNDKETLARLIQESGEHIPTVLGCPYCDADVPFNIQDHPQCPTCKKYYPTEILLKLLGF